MMDDHNDHHQHTAEEWLELIRVAQPVDFVAAFVDAHGTMSRKQLDKKLHALKERALLKFNLPEGALDEVRLNLVLDRQLSFPEMWRVHICLNFRNYEPRDVVAQIKAMRATIGSQLTGLHALKTFARRFYPEIPETWLAKLALPTKETRTRRKAYDQDLILRADTPVQMSALRVWQKLASWIHSDDYVRIACALLICTGRRTVEIGTMGKFKKQTEAHAVKNKFWIAFTGQAKKRKPKKQKQALVTDPSNPDTSGGGPELKPCDKQCWYDIPTFAKPTLVFAALSKLRKAVATPAACKKLWGVQVPDLIKRRFGPQYTARTFRAVYAVLTHTLFRPMVAVNRWTQLILGHSNILISHAYLNVYLYDIERLHEVGGEAAGLIV